MWILNENLIFPPVETASEDGILAIGGDLSTERLLLAYRKGIFPWYNQGEPIIWYSPDPRMVLWPEDLKVSKSLKQVIRNKGYHTSWDRDFKNVIAHCRRIERPGQDGTWITEEMEEAYLKLHALGHARSLEVWKDERLVGGLYGIDLGHVFCGESMFSLESNTSKLAFVSLVEEMKKRGKALIDCQVYNEHLASLGAKEISREEFMQHLNAGQSSPLNPSQGSPDI